MKILRLSAWMLICLFLVLCQSGPPKTRGEFRPADLVELVFSTYPGGSPESRRLRDLLRSAMEAEGFTVLKEEWWHFDYKDWRQYKILNVPFKAMKRENGK